MLKAWNNILLIKKSSGGKFFSPNPKSAATWKYSWFLKWNFIILIPFTVCQNNLQWFCNNKEDGE